MVPAVHLLVKDPVSSDFLMEKLGNSTSCEVQSEMLVLVENFLRHTEASDLEALLNALAQLFPELLRWTLTVRERPVRSS